MSRTHRIRCTSAAVAIALAAFIVAEGHDATWVSSYDTGIPTVLALAPDTCIASATRALNVEAV